jgi:hypothetical protein
VECVDCFFGLREGPADGLGDFAGDLLVEFEGRRGRLRIGEPCGGGGSWCVGSCVFAVCGVYIGEGFHGGKYTIGCGVGDVTPQFIAILSEK